MRIIHIIGLGLIILFYASNLNAQNIKEFSNEPEQFFKELNDLFDKLTVKEQKELSKEMMDKFIEFMSTGVFSKEVKENTISTCNLLLSRRMKAFPEFYNYLSSVNGLMEFDHTTKSYDAWQKSVETVIADKRSTKPLTSFLQTSNELINENVLYRSSATEWRSSTYNFDFIFDTVPKVIFDTLDLTCYSNKDSSVIFNTHGIYYPLDSKWVGQKGKVTWTRAGFYDQDVYALLENYEIYLGFSKYTADSVKFYHKKYWSNPLLGTLEDKILANVTPENATYPVFKSYQAEIEIKDVFENVDFAGGIEMHGRKMFGLGNEEQDAYISFKKDNKEFIKVLTKNVVIYPDRMSSALATATISIENDSIYHPGLQMNYVDVSKELSLVRVGEGTSRSPYYDSFHNMDIYSEAIYWKMNEPLINFESVKGTSVQSKASFESSNFFSLSRYLKLQGIDEVNPLLLVKRYTDKYNTRVIGAQAFSEEVLLPKDQVIAMMINLANRGFVIYDRDEKTAFVKDRMFDYINAMNKKIDYDVLQFNSETNRMQNASLELDSFSLKLNGVPFVYLSDSQNVFIYPTNEQIVVKKGMDFSFAGRVHAGSFDFYTRVCDFNYDQYKLDMPIIDSVSFVVPSFDVNSNGEKYLVKVRSVLSDLGGALYIDDPNNKSGLKPFPEYPIFNSTKDAYVYYDHRSIFNGIYNREKFYFYLYPFTLDSLDNYKTELLEFPGYLASSGIFPDIEDTLRVQKDYSLGFDKTAPPEGFAAYGGKGTYFSDINLSNQGLRGKGSLEYLTSTSWSDDFIFFPDSSNAIAKNFVIGEQLSPVEYPAVKGINSKFHWDPYMDRMIFEQKEVPFEMFKEQSRLLGTLVLTPEKLRGAGKMSFEDAEMQSKLYTFKQHEIFADSADFNLKSRQYTQSAFATRNYNSHIDFNERKGEFVSNGGASVVEFPINQYICTIDEFEWFMDSFEIAMGSPEKVAEMARFDHFPIRELIDVPLEGSEFISINPDQDSLRFTSTVASYNLKEYVLNAEDVKYIRVADAAIFPADHKLVINPGAKMNTIGDAQILANTVTRYHEIYDAVVDIKGKNKYTAIGNYDYVDEKEVRQKIFLKDIGVDPSFQTVGNGFVSDTTGFKISEDFDFSGNILLYANREFLNFDGGFRILHTCEKGHRSWVRFNSDINPQEIYININEKLVSLEKDSLVSGLMFSNESSRFYSGFLTPPSSSSDLAVLGANGYIHYDKASGVYDIASLDKLKGLTMSGNQLSLNRKKCVLKAQGKFNLGAELGRVALGVYGSAQQFIIPDSTIFDLVMTIDFPFDDKALGLMGKELEEQNLPGVNLVRPEFTKGLIDILGEKEADKVISDLQLFGKFRKYPSELEHTITFTDIKFKWNYATRSYISYGPIGIGSIGKDQVNKYVDGYVEIERKRTGDVLSIYLEFEKGKYWYFFNYRNNLMQSISANTEYNAVIQELKDEKRTKKESKEGEEYSFIISNLRKKTDFLTKIKQSSEPN
jgi:hypothetical protein